MEEHWYGRVQQALLQCEQATHRRRIALLEYARELPIPDRHFAVIQAQHYELAALKEYYRVLEIYHNLLRYGEIPQTI